MNLNCGVCCSPQLILNFNVSFRELLTTNAQKEKLRYEAENGKLKDEERRLKQELAFLQKEMSSIGKITLRVYCQTNRFLYDVHWSGPPYQLSFWFGYGYGKSQLSYLDQTTLRCQHKTKPNRHLVLSQVNQTISNVYSLYDVYSQDVDQTLLL